MLNAAKAITALAVLAFLLAVIASWFTGPILGVFPEGFSRASTNLALIAIAVAVIWTPKRLEQ
jgi:hypothetical protein